MQHIQMKITYYKYLDVTPYFMHNDFYDAFFWGSHLLGEICLINERRNYSGQLP